MAHDTDVFLLFLVATLAVNLSPGPSILYVSSVAASSSIRAAFFSVLGMSVGISIHVVAAASGLAALVATSPFTFLMVKYLGALYLIYLGLRVLLTRSAITTSSVLPVQKTAWKFFRQGVLVDLLNPKIGMFFVAFLPQFLGPAHGSSFVQALGLGGVFIVVGAIVNTSIGIAVAKGATSLGRVARAWVERWIPGTILIGLGVRLALVER